MLNMILGFSVMGAISCKAEPIGSLLHGPLFQTSAESASNALANSAFVKNTLQYVKYDLKNNFLKGTARAVNIAFTCTFFPLTVDVYQNMSPSSRKLAFVTIGFFFLSEILDVMKAQKNELYDLIIEYQPIAKIKKNFLSKTDIAKELHIYKNVMAKPKMTQKKLIRREIQSYLYPTLNGFKKENLGIPFYIWKNIYYLKNVLKPFIEDFPEIKKEQTKPFENNSSEEFLRTIQLKNLKKAEFFVDTLKISNQEKMYKTLSEKYPQYDEYQSYLDYCDL